MRLLRDAVLQDAGVCSPEPPGPSDRWGSAAAFKAFIEAETRKWGEIINTVGIKSDQ